MTFKIKCPHCTQNFECAEEMDGSKTECPSCYKYFTIKKPSSFASEVQQEAQTDIAQKSQDTKDLMLKSEASRWQKIVGKMFSAMALLAIAAFFMIGYLAVPFSKEKAVWCQTAKEREANLTDRLGLIEKDKLELLAKIGKDIETSQDKLVSLQVSINGLSEKEKQCEMLAAQISEHNKSIVGLTQKYKDTEATEKIRITALLSPLESERTGLEKDIKVQQDKLSALKVKLQDADSELQNKVNATDSARKQLTQLQEEARQATEIINSGKTQKEQMEKLSSTLQTITKTVSSTQADYQKLLEDQKQAIEKLGLLRNDAQSEIDKTTKKQSELAALNSQISKLKESENKLSSEIDTAKKQLQLLQQAEDTTKTSVNSLEVQKTKLKEDIKQLQADLKEIETLRENNTKKGENQ